MIPPQQVGQRRRSLRPGEMVEDQKRRVKAKPKPKTSARLMLPNAFGKLRPLERQAQIIECSLMGIAFVALRVP